jgi:hypothetical protein
VLRVKISGEAGARPSIDRGFAERQSIARLRSRDVTRLTLAISAQPGGSQDSCSDVDTVRAALRMRA